MGYRVGNVENMLKGFLRCFSSFLKKQPSYNHDVSFDRKKDAAEYKATKSNWIIYAYFPLD